MIAKGVVAGRRALLSGQDRAIAALAQAPDARRAGESGPMPDIPRSHLRLRYQTHLQRGQDRVSGMVGSTLCQARAPVAGSVTMRSCRSDGASGAISTQAQAVPPPFSATSSRK